ncbi:uncharacterized protein BDV14DRAFT_197708 [Aspergillus stella-maris]|uniref:uncharacterized protein n=1 Tax=Aspergillus stella-maris TaxID=1810926 RepID=UPI003CCE1DDD
MLTFPAYRLHAFDQYDEAFGPLADFLVRASKERAWHFEREYRRTSPDSSISEHPCNNCPLVEWLSTFKQLTDPLPWETFLCSEVTQILSALEGLGLHSVFQSIEEIGTFKRPFKDQLNTGFLPPPLQERTSIMIIDPQSHLPRQISFPMSLLDTGNLGMGSTYNSDTYQGIETAAQELRPHSLDERLRHFWLFSGQPNHIKPDLKLSRINLQFYEYILREHLNIRFSDTAFRSNMPNDPYTFTITDKCMFNQPWELDVNHFKGMFARVDVPFASAPFFESLSLFFNIHS